MTITDLPSTIPNPPSPSGDGASADVHLGGGVSSPIAERLGEGTFSLELPGDAPVVIETFSEGSEEEPDPPAAEDIASTLSRTAAPATRPLLPSYAVVVIGGLALACLALCVALVAALSRPEAVTVPTAAPTEIPADPSPEAAPLPEPAPEAVAPAATPADFPAAAVPIPVDLLTELEAASSETLDVELSRLLAAIQHGFGTQSARLEPTLRSYVYRMAARFEWNPDTYRVAVTAPDARLAEARKALLEGLFEEAIASGRLDVGTGTGPHALTLVTP